VARFTFSIGNRVKVQLMITVIANLKGGSGKSTVAFNLAVWLENNGQHVVGYDLDPQCTFSDLGMLRKEIGNEPE